MQSWIIFKDFFYYKYCIHCQMKNLFIPSRLYFYLFFKTKQNEKGKKGERGRRIRNKKRNGHGSVRFLRRDARERRLWKKRAPRMSRGCPARQYEEYTSRLPLRLACRLPVINNMTLTCTFCMPPGTSCPGRVEGASRVPYGPATHTANTVGQELNSVQRPPPSPSAWNQESFLFDQSFSFRDTDSKEFSFLSKNEWDIV